MDQSAKRAARDACKERKTTAGVFAVICGATGQAWVGQSRHLETQGNGLWFVLRHGSCRNAALQAAWTEHGEAAFRFEALDYLPDTVTALTRAQELKKRAALWTARLQGTAL